MTDLCDLENSLTRALHYEGAIKIKPTGDAEHGFVQYEPKPKNEFDILYGPQIMRYQKWP